MTLSRFDEWTGTFATTNNRDANYGLYAFRDPSTPYKRAYWHPGIGIWQYDTAGVGAPFTAIERIDVSIVAADVTAGMASRYCNPSPSLVGHGAPFSDQERRNAAWSPWGYPCALCQQEFDDMTGGATPFANITTVSGISNTGGAVQHTCTLSGVPGTLPCWYVDPSVGVIEGATGWATLDPSGGSSSSVAPAPLAEAFYVVDRGATEERHWLRADTGYDIDIHGSRQVGKNDRPRSNQAGSGVTWSAGSGLCDVTAGRGNCVPVPPAGVSSSPLSISGTYRPVALDADGDGKGDVLWYGAGAASDNLWLGQGSGTFTNEGVAIGGTFDDVLAGDVDGDGDSDVLWYARASGRTYLWRADGDGTFTSETLPTLPGRIPFLLDSDGDGHLEAYWYGPGSVPDRQYYFGTTGFVGVQRSLDASGSYRPVVGDFDGNGRDDIAWYAPGSAADHLWLFSSSGHISSRPLSVSGSYTPLVGDYDGNGADDLLFYGFGRVADSLWFGGPGAAFAKVGIAVNGEYLPVVADLLGDGRDDVLWYAAGSRQDTWWQWNAGRVVTSQGFAAAGPHFPLVGGFSAGGDDGVLWYAPGPHPDTVWWR
jgi:hypothetical protein